MTYDNTDERGEDAVARQRGGSEPPTVRDTIASLREGDEIEVVYRGKVSRVRSSLSPRVDRRRSSSRRSSSTTRRR